MRKELAVSLLALMTGFVGNEAGAQASTHEAKAAINIEAQPLERALNQLGQQFDVQIVLYSEDASNLKSKKLKGQYTEEEALNFLLADTGLRFRNVNDLMIAVGTPERLAANENPAVVAQADLDPVPVTSRSGGLDEVVVTARKQAENLQQTPVAVTAFTASDLKAQSAVGLIDLQYQTPGLVIQSNGQAAGTLNYQIRGQYQVAAIAVLDPPIGLYQDGIYTGSHVGSALTGLLDVERVEILKGPQGTLYGRNTTGGAIGVYTKMPTDEFEGEITVGAGNDERYLINGVLNIPLVEDQAAFRLVASKSWDGGYGTNVLNGKSLSNPEDIYFRGTLKLDPTNSLEIVLRGDYSKMESDGRVVAPLYLQPFSLANVGYGVAAGIPGPPPAGPTFGPGMARYATFKNLPGYPYNVAMDNQLEHMVEIYGTSLTLSKDVGGATIKSITSYRRVETDVPTDFDATSDLIFSSLDHFGTKSRLFTQEFQLTGLTFEDRLKYVLGAFYIDMRSVDYSNSYAVPAVTGGRVGYGDNVVNTESPALYGQATYELIPSVHITGGLRWTEEERITTISDFDTDLTTGAFLACTTPLPATAASCYATYGVKETNISYLAGVDWNASDDVMLYVRTARGFKSGGVNERVTTDPATVSPFESEIVTDWEVGVKSEFLDNRVRLNAAFFRSDYDELQRAVFKSIGGAPVNVVQNAGKATIDGIEFEGQALPIENLSIRASATWTDARYDEYVDGLGVDLSDTKFPLISDWTYSVSGAYTVPLNSVDLRFQLDWNYRSDYSLSPTGEPKGVLTQEGYGLLNGQVSAEMEELGLSVRGYVKNITDEFYWNAVFDTTAVPVTAALGVVGGVPSRPRTYGVEVTKKF